MNSDRAKPAGAYTSSCFFFAAVTRGGRVKVFLHSKNRGADTVYFFYRSNLLHMVFLLAGACEGVNNL